MAWIEKPRKLRDGTVRWRVGYRVDGFIKVESFARKRDAQRRKNEIEYEQDAGTFTDPEWGKIPLEEFWEYFIRAYKPDARATESLYRRHAPFLHPAEAGAAAPPVHHRPGRSQSPRRTAWSGRWAGHYRCRVPPS
jgi:hypothetical protein